MTQHGSMIVVAGGLLIAFVWFTVKAILGHLLAGWVTKQVAKKHREKNQEDENVRD